MVHPTMARPALVRHGYREVEYRGFFEIVLNRLAEVSV